MLPKIKCSLKQCVQYEDGYCDSNLPNMVKKLLPDSIKCTFFDADTIASFKYFKEHGGTQGAFARLKGKELPEPTTEQKNPKKLKLKVKKSKDE